MMVSFLVLFYKYVLELCTPDGLLDFITQGSGTYEHCTKDIYANGQNSSKWTGHFVGLSETMKKLSCYKVL